MENIKSRNPTRIDNVRERKRERDNKALASSSDSGSTIAMSYLRDISGIKMEATEVNIEKSPYSAGV